jgi:septal ring factor EnvC (AmiA/AmiB activator)
MRARSLCIAVLLAAGVAHAQAPQQKLSSTLEHLAKSKQAEAELKKKLAATENELQAMRERAAKLAEQLQKTERRVDNEEEALAKVNAEYAQKRREFDVRKNDYAATVVTLLRMRNMPTTALFSSTEDTQTMLRTASVLEKTNAALANKATRLRADMAQIKLLQSNVKARDASTRAERLKLNAEQEKLDRELAARQKLHERLNSDHAREAAKMAELSRESQSLQELIGKLAENEKEKAKIKSTPKLVTKLRSFDGKKGSARTPIAGEVIHRFGEKQNDNGTYRGMVFKARAGATVVAPYDGEVVFTGPFRDYGNMVLIKHKNGFISLIAGLGKVSTNLNQAAIRGEPIGTMPTSGKAEAYVELRDSSAKPIDPANWFANVVAN